MWWWIVGSVLYLAIAGAFLYAITAMKKRLLGRKHYRRDPDRLERDFGGFWTDLVASLLWPLQIIGFLFYGMKG